MTDIDKLLQQQQIPPSEPSARQAAMRDALEAFEQEHQASQGNPENNRSSSQGFWQRLRLIKDATFRSIAMTSSTTRTLFAGLAAASVTVLGLFIVLPALLTVSPPSIDESEVTLTDIKLSSSKDAAARAPMIEDVMIEELVVRGEPRRVVEGSHAAPASAPIQAPQKASMDFAHGTVLNMRAPTGSDSLPRPMAQNRDKFSEQQENPVKRTLEAPVSTFSVDVDTASYSFVRRQLNSGVLPAKNAVRVEEMLNYFDYAYPTPQNREQPFLPSIAVTDSPWAEGKKLLHIGIKGYDLSGQKVPKTNLVFLLDVSGSMNSPDKLPLVKQSMDMLLGSLKPDDTVAIVVYAGAAGTVLEPTAVKDKQKILAALRNLQAGGSTAGAQGIQQAYQLAEANFDDNAINRVILATDGDFNVGISDTEQLKGYIERKRNQGIFLSVLGFGQGNYNDELMQTLAQNGNGVAAYLDTLGEAQKVLVQEANSALFPIAKDVKIQLEFNPDKIAEYRLIGYETRILNREDFNNDKVDAGDIGAGHSVTALYELTLTDSDAQLIDPNRYGKNPEPDTENSSEYGYLKLRYKLPEQSTSQLLEQAITADDKPVDQALLNEVNFAIAVAGFGQKLTGSVYLHELSYDDIIAMAQASKGEDLYGYRTEFIQLVRKAKIAKEL
ncbi:VWA domain-containing protein [uncultured Gilvimarinus sp.]|uniref:vWA domain-containing protein n=1 Tax=uncultured Gilvimarinus sp. TaxID=1689143 RepID=UPI0030ECB18D|tara:strand:+ start:1141 stop:3141 length:2001 start_codon:yes stop_codon:yes gene_type:complete